MADMMLLSGAGSRAHPEASSIRNLRRRGVVSSLAFEENVGILLETTYNDGVLVVAVYDDVTSACRFPAVIADTIFH
jgi:hypothetical protein